MNLIITCWKWRSSGFPWSQHKKQDKLAELKKKDFSSYFLHFSITFHMIQTGSCVKQEPFVLASLDIYSGPYYKLTGQGDLSPVAGKEVRKDALSVQLCSDWFYAR